MIADENWSARDNRNRVIRQRGTEIAADLVGKSESHAQSIVDRHPDYFVYFVPAGSPVTADAQAHRIHAFVSDGHVVYVRAG